jgi:hypothetical protein
MKEQPNKKEDDEVPIVFQTIINLLFRENKGFLISISIIRMFTILGKIVEKELCK